MFAGSTTRVGCLGALACALVTGACGRDKPASYSLLGAEAANWLSSRGLYADIEARRVVDGAIAYTPDFPLWSDGAEKTRWLILPPGTRIDTSDMDHWRFPVGTKAFKEFRLGDVLLETRLLERVADTGEFDLDYRLQTFVWNSDQTDAELTTDGVKATNGTDHEVPRQKACSACHKGEPGAFLGFSAVQLARSGTAAALAAAGVLTVDPGRAFAIPGDPTIANAVGVLHANCGHCHSATGPQPKLRLRFLTTEIDQPPETWELYQSTIGRAITEDWLDPPPQFGIRVRPGEPDRSAIVYRMEQRPANGRAVDQMPPLATNKVDRAGAAAVRAWVQGLAAPAPAGGP